MFFSVKNPICIFLFIGAVILSSGCAQNLSPEYLAKASPEDRTLALLKSPAVGDMYAARVDHFSNYEYGDGGAAFGALQVTEVTPQELTLHSSTAASIDSSMALSLIQKSLAEVDWDSDEQIVILRAELLSLFYDGMILEAMRPGLKQNRNQ